MQAKSISSWLPAWRTLAALLFFVSGMAGFGMGVAVTDRPGLPSAGMLTHAYYSLSLFVMGGVDLGTPVGGPLLGRCLLWLAYFGAPVLAASTVVGALLRGLAPQHWQLRRIKQHVIVAGSGDLALSYLRVLRKHNPRIPVVVINKDFEPSVAEELKQAFGAIVLVGDITHEFFLKQLRLECAAKVLLMCDDSLRSYEAASSISRLVPDIGSKVVIHCSSLRFMRAMASSSVARQSQTFNTYHLAAAGLVQDHLLSHFQSTAPRDTIVLAGYGRFGQTIVEALLDQAADELDTVVIVDQNARRRVLIADEQREFTGSYHRAVFEGDISHPEVWMRIQGQIELDRESTIIVLGTGLEQENLRTALWLKKKYPRAKVIARSARGSYFASTVSGEHDVINISITELVEASIPIDWVDFS
jgi:voltage-gated potassium channel Kch